MKKIGIIGAMQIELDLIINKMDHHQEIPHAGFPFHTGTLNGKDVVLTRCGVGKVNAAACTQILIDKYEVDCVINTGIAGGLSPEIGICDLVISTDVTHHDVRKDQMKNLFPFQETFSANKDLLELAKNACKITNLVSNYHVGRIISGECFVADKTLKETLISEYSPACVEMEGSAIGHVSFINNVPFLILRSISDNADDEAGATYLNFEKLAANQSASILLEMVRHM
ncbi:5'-methylthioadenosine/adenosylhomocysteine nucleosidase [Pseudoneobacillus sp. C159]